MRYFKLRFLSGLHVDSKGSGEPESALEYVRSDTLSAALMLTWSTVYPDEQPSASFLSPPFTVSSAFPYVGDVLLFPCPVWPVWKDLDVSQRKTVKGIQWISQGLLERVLSGEWLDAAAHPILDCGIIVTQEELSANPGIQEMEAWILSERQRVSVDRLGARDGGTTFFFALQHFAPFSGLYFLADAEDSVVQQLEATVRFLGDTGLGADRNSGLGHFRLEEAAAFEFVSPTDPEGMLALSLINPGPNDDIQAMIQNAAYDLETRSGWIVNSTIGRPPIRVFSEGSFLHGRPHGRVVEMLDARTREKFDLQLDHSAPRDFRAFGLPCKTPPYVQREEI